MRKLNVLHCALIAGAAATLAACGGGGAPSAASPGPAPGPAPAPAPNPPPPPPPPPPNPGPPPPPNGDDVSKVGFTGQSFAGLNEANTAANCDPASPANADFSTNVYNVGPGQTYATLRAIPWESLPSHAMVRVHHQAASYRERIFMLTSHLKVCGVPGPNGARPVIDGRNAVIRNNAAFNALTGDPSQDYSTVTRGVVAIGQQAGVSHLAVEGLALTGTMSAPYTDADHRASFTREGSATAYPYNGHTGCIYVQKAQDIVVRGNEISFCPNGIMIISKDWTDLGDDRSMVRNFLLEGNYIHDNGLLGTYDTHQAYLQGVNFVLQYNYFGNPIRWDANNNGTVEAGEGAWGNDVKLRTVGDLVRYNYFENGAHAIDLIDIEDFRPSVFPWAYTNAVRDATNAGYASARPAMQTQMLTDYQKWLHGSYVYGNLFRRDSTVYGAVQGASMVHYGSDNSPLDGRRGPLWFYHNSVISAIDKNSQGAVTLFQYSLDNATSFDFYRSARDGYLRLVGDMYQIYTAATGGSLVADIVRRSDLPVSPADEPVMAPPINVLNNAIYVGKAVAGQAEATGTATVAANPFHWNTYQMDRIFLGKNWITSNWNGPVYGGDPTPGFGVRKVVATVNNLAGTSSPGFFYPGGQAPEGAAAIHHVAGLAKLTVADLTAANAAAPLDLKTYQPVAGGSLCGLAEALPASIPDSVRPRFQVSRVTNAAGQLLAGQLQIRARSASATVGAVECSQ